VMAATDTIQVMASPWLVDSLAGVISPAMAPDAELLPFSEFVELHFEA
jgi:hypothetical protein